LPEAAIRRTTRKTEVCQVSKSVFSGAGRGEGARPLADVLRPVGRLALWAVLAVLLIRGVAAIFSAPASKSTEVGPKVSANPGRATETVAVGFARTFLDTPAPEARPPFLAEGAHVSAGEGLPRPGLVDQAEVVGVARLGEQRWVLTVSCDLRDSRV